MAGVSRQGHELLGRLRGLSQSILDYWLNGVVAVIGENNLILANDSLQLPVADSNRYIGSG